MKKILTILCSMAFLTASLGLTSCAHHEKKCPMMSKECPANMKCPPGKKCPKAK